MPGLPGIELPLICLGELNAPKSCWIVVGGWDEAAECMPGGVCPFFENATGDPVVLPLI